VIGMRRHHYRRKQEQADLDITTFLNLIVVLIPFLLVTAVFSRITIQELNLPSQAADGSKPDEPSVTIEVILRKSRMELTNGRHVTASIPQRDGKYDIKKLSDRLLQLKRKYSQKDDATLLVEPEVEYEDVIHVMDAMKVAEIRREGLNEVLKVDLFPQLSLGDAP
jgi:biopolymer transport protein ExbD